MATDSVTQVGAVIASRLANTHIRATQTGAAVASALVDTHVRVQQAGAVIASCLVLTPPSDVVAVIDGADIDLTWTNNSDVGVRIEHSTNGVDYTTLVELIDGIAGYTHVEPDQSTLHYYRLYAHDGLCLSDASPVVSIAYGKVYVYATEFSNGGEDVAIPSRGDRSAYRVVDYPDDHADDIRDSTLTRHLPAPSAGGTYARDNGTNWVAQLGLLLADLTGYVRGAIILGGAAAWEALTIGAANTVLKSDGTDVTWGNVAHSELSGVGTSDHHDPVTLDANADEVLSLSTQVVGLVAQGANEVFAGPTSGADAAPTFRGLVADDLPAHTHVETDITDLDHTDDDAIHDNVAGEIHAIAAKATPVDADELVIEDSADSWAKKRVALSTLLGGGGASALDDLSDVDAATPNNGDVLTYDDGSGDWVAAAPTGGSGSGSAASDPVFHVAGALSVATDVNGAWIAPRGATIQYVYIYCRDPGSAGSTIVDVNLNGTSIFATTQANRPTLAYDDADQVAKSGAPDTTALVENDVLSIDIDQVGTDAEDLTVIVALEVTPTDAADITYTPAVAADWDSDADPGDVDDALDQLAERVDDLETGARAYFVATVSANWSISPDKNVLTVPFDTELFDQGNYYDVATYRWTPPAGLVIIFVQLHFNVSSSDVSHNVYKNGSEQTYQNQRTGSSYAMGDNTIYMDVANGSDYYEVCAYEWSGSTQITPKSKFMGIAL